MDDESLVRLFEAGEMPPNGFHHPDHVRVAWWYLTQHQLPEALSRFTSALRRFAVAQGKPQLFHETITTAYMLLINERLDDSSRGLTWDGFAAGNHGSAVVAALGARSLLPRGDTLVGSRASDVRDAGSAGACRSVQPSTLRHRFARKVPLAAPRSPQVANCSVRRPGGWCPLGQS